MTVNVKGPFPDVARVLPEFRKAAASDREHWFDLGLIAMKTARVLRFEGRRDDG